MPKQAPPAPLVVSAATAAELLDCSRQYVHRLVERGELRSIRMPEAYPGAKRVAIRIPLADIHELLGLTVAERGAGDA